MCAREVAFFKSAPRCCLLHADTASCAKTCKSAENNEGGRREPEEGAYPGGNIMTPNSTPEQSQATLSASDNDSTLGMHDSETSIEAVERLLVHGYRVGVNSRNSAATDETRTRQAGFSFGGQGASSLQQRYRYPR